jgi:VanZ family protein
VRVKSDARAGRHALRWLPALAWMAWISYLSHQSAPLGGATGNIDVSFGHVALYGALALLLFWALLGISTGRGGPLWLVAGLTFALTVLYGAGDEVHQGFVAGRTASEADLGLDAAGALLAVLLAASLLQAARSWRP